MRNTCFGLVASVVLLSGVARGAEPSATAQDRATLYQREVRAALTERHWNITQDEPGKLTAERLELDQRGTGGLLFVGGVDTYARLQISFRADSKTHTSGAAYASLCIYAPDQHSRTTYPPLALRDPRLTREYRDIVAESESRLAPRFRPVAATGTDGGQDAGNPRRIAMK